MRVKKRRTPRWVQWCDRRVAVSARDGDQRREQDNEDGDVVASVSDDKLVFFLLSIGDFSLWRFLTLVEEISPFGP